MSDTKPRRLDEQFVHLALGARVLVQPPFDGMSWYEDYGARHGADGAEGRLVSMYVFDEDWDSWEMHPVGEEMVLCTAGHIVLIQENEDGSRRSVPLDAGEYAINPAGTWHTADIGTSATCVFITAGEGTENRPRTD